MQKHKPNILNSTGILGMDCHPQKYYRSINLTFSLCAGPAQCSGNTRQEEELPKWASSSRALLLMAGWESSGWEAHLTWWINQRTSSSQWELEKQIPYSQCCMQNSRPLPSTGNSEINPVWTLAILVNKLIFLLLLFCWTSCELINCWTISSHWVITFTLLIGSINVWVHLQVMGH